MKISLGLLSQFVKLSTYEKQTEPLIYSIGRRFRAFFGGLQEGRIHDHD